MDILNQKRRGGTEYFARSVCLLSLGSGSPGLEWMWVTVTGHNKSWLSKKGLRRLEAGCSGSPIFEGTSQKMAEDSYSDVL